MAVCPECGEKNPERAKFCLNCATSLSASRPEQRRRPATLLFCDVSGSTATGERLDAEAVRELMFSYFHEMRSAIERHGGTVEKFVGDAVMAVFGVPEAHEDDPLRACRAAAEMQQRLTELNRELERRYGSTLAIRIGVNTGEVVAGDPRTRETFVSGDTVNTAARLEQAAAPGEVLLGSLTYALVEDTVEAEAVAPIQAKGKAEPVSAYRLLSVPSAPGPRRRPRTPLVGRERELAALRAVYDDALAESAARMALLTGEPGVGKSRLAEEFLSTVAADARVLSGRCLPYGEGITYWPLAEIVRSAASIHDEHGLKEARAKLDRLLENVSGGETVAALLAQALGLSKGAASPLEIAWAARRLGEMLAKERPLVLLVDDLQWAEEALLALMGGIGERGRGRIMLLCLARPEFLEEHPNWRPTVRLAPLDVHDAAELAEQLLGAQGGRRDRVVATAGGNPLFLEELSAMVTEDGLGHGEIPPTLDALLAARLDRLPEKERDAAERASVEGQVFHRGAVLALSDGRPHEDVSRALAALQEREFVLPAAADFVDEAAYRFRHLLLRDAAYRALSKRLRSDLHGRFAIWLEAKAGDRLAEVEEILGHHLEQAYRYRAELGPVDERGLALAERASTMLGSAGQRAFARGDSTAAVTLLDRSASLLPLGDPARVELLPVLAEVLAEIGDYPRAEEVLQEAVESAEALGDARLLAHARIGQELQRTRANPDLEGLRERVKRAVAIFEAAGDELGLARSWRLLAYVPYVQARAAETEEALLRSVHHARRAGAHREEAQSLVYLVEHGRHGEMPLEEGLRRCDEFLSRVNSRWLEAEMLVLRSGMEAQLDRPEKARASITEARTIFEEIGSEFGVLEVEDATGWVELHTGDPASAEEHLRRAYEGFMEVGEVLGAGRLAIALAKSLWMQGKHKGAEQLASIVRESAPPADVLLQAGWRGLQGLVLARRRELEGAERLAREAVTIADTSDWLELRAEARLDLGEVLRIARRLEEALSVLEDALRLYVQKGNLASARTTRALLEQLRGAAPSAP